MEINVNPSLVGGALTVTIFIGIIWLAFKAIKTAIFWAALGGIPIFKISSTAFEMLLNGEKLPNIIRQIGFNIIFFLQPIDEIYTYDADLYVIIPITIILAIWLLLCVRFAMVSLAVNMFNVDSVWGIPLGISLWYVLTGTARGFRSYLSSALPALEPLLMSYYGIMMILLPIVAVTPIAYWKFRHTSLEVME